MPAIELSIEEAPGMYRRLARAIGEANWQGAVERQEDAIRSNFFLRDYLRSEYAIAYQLDHLRKLAARFGEVPHGACNNPDIFPALAFGAQVLEVLERSIGRQGKTFVKRVQTAFRSVENMHGLVLELQAATHFVRRGHHVALHRRKNEGTFDLLVKDLGPNGLEIECKSISEDKGRRIHRRDVLEFLGEMQKDLTSVANNLSSGLVVVLTVPDRLPRETEKRAVLAGEVIAQINTGSSATLSGGTNVRIVPFDPVSVATTKNGSREQWRKAIDAVTGTVNRDAVFYETAAGGMLALVMQSTVNDDVLNQVFATLDDSAARQFTGGRGALFWVALQGVDATELQSLHDDDNLTDGQPTSLRLAASNFLHRAPGHIVGVVFNSRTGLLPAIEGSTDSGGRTYFFLKEESPFWHASFRNPLTIPGKTD